MPGRRFDSPFGRACRRAIRPVGPVCRGGRLAALPSALPPAIECRAASFALRTGRPLGRCRSGCERPCRGALCKAARRSPPARCRPLCRHLVLRRAAVALAAFELDCHCLAMARPARPCKRFLRRPDARGAGRAGNSGGLPLYWGCRHVGRSFGSGGGIIEFADARDAESRGAGVVHVDNGGGLPL